MNCQGSELLNFMKEVFHIFCKTFTYKASEHQPVSQSINQWVRASNAPSGFDVSKRIIEKLKENTYVETDAEYKIYPCF